MHEALQLEITGCPTFYPTFGEYPWSLEVSELIRFSDDAFSSSRQWIAPPNRDPIPPLGIWRVFKGHPHWVEQLQELRIEDVDFREDVHDPGVRLSIEAYVEYFRLGFEPPPADVVFNAPTGRLLTLNRRRVWAAKLAGLKKFKAWVGGYPYEEMMQNAASRGLIKPVR
jgi:hypothetical protein